MRDREFAVAKKALVEGTQDKTTIPESWSLIGDGVLHGKKGKQHTLVIPVAVPNVKFDAVRLEVLGDGKLLEKPREFAPSSWTRNHWNMKFSHFGYTNADDASPDWGDSYLNGKDTGGTIRSSARAFVQYYAGHLEAGTYGYLSYSYPVISDYRGVVVGTGTAAESFEDYALDTQVSHGVGAGQLYYATSPVPAPDYFDTDTQIYELSRYFDNFSGGSVSLSEMGQISRSRIASDYNFLVARDLISPSLSVPFRAQARISYTYSLVYPGSGSPLRNYYNSMFSHLASVNAADSGSFANGYINGKDTSGTIQYSGVRPFGVPDNASCHANGTNNGLGSVAGNDGHGIVVGTGNTAVSFEDYALDTQVADGSGAGELDYGAHEVPARSWDAGPRVLTVRHARTFANNSGGSIGVQESGAIARLAPPGALSEFLVFRDVFSTVNVGNGESLRVVYAPQATFPS